MEEGLSGNALKRAIGKKRRKGTFRAHMRRQAQAESQPQVAAAESGTQVAEPVSVAA